MNDAVPPSTPSGRRDPGWRPLLRYLPVLIYPDARAWSWWLNRRGEPFIVLLRARIASFSMFYLVALVVLSLLDLDAKRPDSPAAEGVWALALVGLCSASLAAGVWWSRRPISCGGPQELRQAFTNRYLLPVAFVSFAVLVAFVASFILFRLWPYLLGVAFGLVGMALVVPTAGRVERRLEELSRAGCPGALQEVLF